MKLCFKSLLFSCIYITIATTAISQNRPRGLDFEDEIYSTVKKKAKLTRALDSVPSFASIKKFAPIPKSQGPHGTCVAWATAYCASTINQAIKNNWTNKDTITHNAYSPAFLFRLLKPNDQNCVGGSSVITALRIEKEQGMLAYKELSDICTPAVSETQLLAASNSKIKDYMRVFDVESPAKTKIQAVKKSISENKPVVIAMTCPSSFDRAKDVWKPTEQPDASKYGGHALCVVGYDDNKDGGAFEIQNSWGTVWGNGGYIWIDYETFAAFTRYGFEVIDLPEPKPAIADLSGHLKLVLSSGSEMQANLLVSTRGLSVVPAKTAPGPLTVYQLANAYSSGTRFRIYISNNEPAYVYAISSDLTNEVTKIFPYDESISAALTDKKSDVAIPDEEHFIEFDNKPGKDFLCVLYSKNELNINDIVQQVSSQQGSFSERIFKVIGDNMVEPKNIQFSKTNISFQGYSRGKSVVALMVEMEHK